jgi:hypothetical protein
MKLKHKDHTIECISRSIPFSDRWSAKVIISWSKTGTKIQEFDGPIGGFSSKADAEIWGIDFGKKWIDAGKPPLR